MVARGRLAGNGPGVFGPVHEDSRDVAGHGVADPSSMCSRRRSMLGEGLGEHAAAETLAVALPSAAPGARTVAPGTREVAETTREFADAVLGAASAAVRNASSRRRCMEPA